LVTTQVYCVDVCLSLEKRGMDFNYKPGKEIPQQKIDETFYKLAVELTRNDLALLKKNLSNVVFVLSRLIDLIYEKQISFPKWMRSFEALAIKLTQHSYAVGHLADALPLGKNDQGNVITVFDLSSLFVIARAQMEAYLTLYYLILSPDTHEQGEFYDLQYQLSGLCNRQDMPVTLQEHIEKQQQEAMIIEQLKSEIACHPYLPNIESDLRNKMGGRKPLARLCYGWVDLIKKSNLNDALFAPRWKHYSGYAHSEYISLLQLKDYFRTPAHMQRETCHTVECATMIASITVTELLNLIPSLQDDYSANWTEEQRATIYFYSKTMLKPSLQHTREFSLASVKLCG
jgi:hypothetical protein